MTNGFGSKGLEVFIVSIIATYNRRKSKYRDSVVTQWQKIDNQFGLNPAPKVSSAVLKGRISENKFYK